MTTSAVDATVSGNSRQEDDVVTLATRTGRSPEYSRLVADAPKDTVAEPRKDETMISQYVRVELYCSDRQ